LSAGCAAASGREAANTGSDDLVNTRNPAYGRPSIATSRHPGTVLLWLTVLVVASVETIVAVIERWPAQLGGGADPSKIASQWVTRGTALSPPLFILVAMALAPLLLMVGRRIAVVRAAGVIAALAGAVGTVGSLGEFLSPATAEVSRGVQNASLIGVVASLLLLVTGAWVILKPSHFRSRQA
jgi:hypothetical protein